jgi:hypothetical protein
MEQTAVQTHTPGPWTVAMDYRDRWHRSIMHGDKPFMYTRFFPEGNGFTPRGEIDDEMDANAHLIAAAPELLAALEELLDQIRVECHHTGINVLPSLNAIKQARG